MLTKQQLKQVIGEELGNIAREKKYPSVLRLPKKEKKANPIAPYLQPGISIDKRTPYKDVESAINTVQDNLPSVAVTVDGQEVALKKDAESNYLGGSGADYSFSMAGKFDENQKKDNNMKLSKTNLQRIIQEEIQAVLKEVDVDPFKGGTTKDDPFKGGTPKPPKPPPKEPIVQEELEAVLKEKDDVKPVDDKGVLQKIKRLEPSRYLPKEKAKPVPNPERRSAEEETPAARKDIVTNKDGKGVKPKKGSWVKAARKRLDDKAKKVAAKEDPKNEELQRIVQEELQAVLSEHNGRWQDV